MTVTRIYRFFGHNNEVDIEFLKDDSYSKSLRLISQIRLFNPLIIVLTLNIQEDILWPTCLQRNEYFGLPDKSVHKCLVLLFPTVDIMPLI